MSQILRVRVSCEVEVFITEYGPPRWAPQERQHAFGSGAVISSDKDKTSYEKLKPEKWTNEEEKPEWGRTRNRVTMEKKQRLTGANINGLM